MTTLNAGNVALNAELKETGGSKCQANWRLWMPSWPMALNAWLWTMALNAKLWKDGGSERLTVNNDSECQTVNDGYESQTKDTMALNVKLKIWL